mmetsp:Transcript_19630/g.48184  ORF Transcript_19630/g.48184 Transcript_19630/m.48184 type:complete len:292 (+) Transcript_19630:64-939(+)|eukprot:CAMPEP_0206243464 /NCGR_PEP_ID=MMETSP0047_2-20121206/17620_1 /ASSEMBLY_ACC=CAM_ASM_000192 /TAXON_ID=195065 /ORGANISM="Chroomonas mesostigmatica_cf, Strain CCMP1168" /LENGTH=291 /DNA_ID=CAMNT_0053668583 /DNA_START=158 /DNA_END=1033 /DNA_ORIENTATION=+
MEVAADSQTPDGQLQIGIQLIQQSYSRRVDDLMREVEHWKRVSQHHKQQESTTRDELAKANQRAAELQRQLGEKQHEVVSLTEARNVALNQISTLKKHAAQLQNFKKNISNMLQAEAGLDGPLSSINVQGMLDSLPVDSTFSSTLPSPALETYNRPANLASSGTYFNGDPYAPSASAAPRMDSMSSSYPSHATSAPIPRSTTPAAPAVAPEVTLDAATYYQQVKRVLEPEQFREFSANIKKLNAGHQSVDETLEKVREIFGEHRPFLFAQLQKLIRQAEDEARKQQEDGGI